ncbi:acetate--CoA ligase family protein [Rhodopila sp.]|uniref:acetate--CoA ligase family protein n=1 Tax=Rhodopila sp. TaxID=2480087 RepID=UPI003D0F30F5
MNLAGEGRDLSTMLRPRSIALVGATDRSGWSKATFANLTTLGYDGEVHLVARRGGVVHGRTSATSCAALGAKVDLGLLMVPAASIEEAIADLGAAGGRNAVILTSGFAETGTDGAAQQQRLAVLARRFNISILGPNCLGFVNFLDNVPLWTGAIRAPSRPGPIAVISQSGATAAFIASLALQQAIGLSHMISTGNEADLDSASFVDHLLDDARVRAIAMFIESIRDPHAFAAAAQKACAAGKPIVALKIGLSDVTARSAQAHTGSLVGDDRVFDGVCRQFGIVRVNSIEDLLFTADIIARTGVIGEKGLGLVSVSGGACEIAADRLQTEGVPLPPLPAATETALRSVLPSFGTPHNPLDITGGAVLEPELFRRALTIIGHEPAFSALACLFDVPGTEALATEFQLASLRQISAGLNEQPLPALMISHSLKPVTEVTQRIVSELNLPYVSAGIYHGLAALGRAWWWSEQQRRVAMHWAPPPVLQAPSPWPKTERAVLDHLARHGVPIVPATLVSDEASAAAAARASGGPVVLKIASVDIQHKSDIGGVALNVAGDAAVGAAFRRVMAAAPAGAQVDGVLVSPMRERGVELFVGCTRDPQWGPVLAVGLGGIFVELLQDVALRVLPVTPDEVRRMLGELKGAKMLRGQRGVPAADLDAVAQAIARIGDASVALGSSLDALDVNPLWVRGSEVEALDGLALARTA